tara:strand:+ start:95 stop:826 length:732 start_codon:yes stop_codon:yes gene_type:complete
MNRTSTRKYFRDSKEKMFLTRKKYKEVLKLKKKFYFSDFDLITSYGLFSGDTNLYKTLTIYDLIKKTSKIKGDIIELGVWRGNTSLLIKKILDIFKIKKKVFLLDHFKGLVHYNKKDIKTSKAFKGQFVSKKKQIRSFIKFFRLKNIEIIDKDATTLKPGFFKKKKFAFAYFDMDLYQPTIKGLQSIDKNMTIGSLIVFDEGNKNQWSERLAIRDFLRENKKYKKLYLNKYRQPDIILKKIRN